MRNFMKGFLLFLLFFFGAGKGIYATASILRFIASQYTATFLQSIYARYMSIVAAHDDRIQVSQFGSPVATLMY